MSRLKSKCRPPSFPQWQQYPPNYVSHHHNHRRGRAAVCLATSHALCDYAYGAVAIPWSHWFFAFASGRWWNADLCNRRCNAQCNEAGQWQTTSRHSALRTAPLPEVHQEPWRKVPGVPWERADRHVPICSAAGCRYQETHQSRGQGACRRDRSGAHKWHCCAVIRHCRGRAAGFWNLRGRCVLFSLDGFCRAATRWQMRAG